jgi:pimeloyl-ACP methyl ester carboxylesterase
MKKLEVTTPRGSKGTIHYRDEGDGAPVVFVHGLLVSGALWDDVIANMPKNLRCIAPDWPLGSHTEGMSSDCDISPMGVAELIGAFLDALDLHDVTLVGNDSGGAICQLVMTKHRSRIARVVLTTCDAFDIFPPKLFAYLSILAKVPALIPVMAKLMWWFAPLRSLPIAYGLLTRNARIARHLTDAWVRPIATRADVRRDLRKFLLGVSPRVTELAAADFGDVTIPVMVAWAPEDPSFPMRLAEALVNALPNATLVTIKNSYVFSALDQPAELARLVSEFALRTGEVGTVPYATLGA